MPLQLLLALQQSATGFGGVPFGPEGGGRIFEFNMSIYNNSSCSGLVRESFAEQGHCPRYGEENSTIEACCAYLAYNRSIALDKCMIFKILNRTVFKKFSCGTPPMSPEDRQAFVVLGIIFLVFIGLIVLWFLLILLRENYKQLCCRRNENGQGAPLLKAPKQESTNWGTPDPINPQRVPSH